MAGFHGGSDSKESACTVRPGFNPLGQESVLRRECSLIPIFLSENSMDRRAQGPQSLGSQRVKATNTFNFHMYMNNQLTLLHSSQNTTL